MAVVYSEFKIGQIVDFAVEGAKGTKYKARHMINGKAKVIAKNGHQATLSTLKGNKVAEGVIMRAFDGHSFAILDTADTTKCAGMARILVSEASFEEEVRKQSAITKIGMYTRRNLLEQTSADDLERIVDIMANNSAAARELFATA